MKEKLRKMGITGWVVGKKGLKEKGDNKGENSSKGRELKPEKFYWIGIKK